MGFNRRKLEDQRREVAEKEAAARRATEAQVLEDAERLIAAWNERQAKRMPMIFSPTIGAAIAARYWFLWVRCPACWTINAIDLRCLDRHPDAAVSSMWQATDGCLRTYRCGQIAVSADVGKRGVATSAESPSQYAPLCRLATLSFCNCWLGALRPGEPALSTA